jgi:hypothetical protein
MMVIEHELSVRQACRTARLARSAFYVPRRPRDDRDAIETRQCHEFCVFEPYLPVNADLKVTHFPA